MVKLDSPTASAADIYMEEQMRSVFQWEKSSGLEHSCYACNTKSNSPKALQTCYGVHSIPCSRYHQTMHAIGTSHNCDACIKADSLHDCRHRKIAELLAEYRSIPETDTSSNKKNKKGMCDTNAFPITPTPLRERDVNAVDIPLNGPAPNRRHPHDLEPLDLENIHIYADDDDADNDKSTISSSTGSATSKLTKAEVRAVKRNAKQAKSEQKSLKNQSKHPVIVRSADVAHVHLVLHGEAAHDQSGNPTTPTTPNGSTDAALSDPAPTAPADTPTEPASRHPLATDSNIEDVLQRNIGYVRQIKDHKAYLLRTIAGKKRTERAKRDHRNKARNTPVSYDEDGVAIFEDPEAEEDLDALIDAVLARFGILAAVSSAEGGKGGKRAWSTGGKGAQNAILAQLRVAIGDDLTKHENEQRMTCIRAGGFWRYVGKGVFERMMRVGERIDWRTGVIIRDEKTTVDGSDEGGDGLEEEAGA